MKHWRSKIALLVLFFLPAFLAPFPLSPSDLSEIEALAPVAVVAEGFKEPTGVVVDQNGVIFVSDRKTGEVLQISAGAVHPFISHLQRPVGLSFDGEGRLLIVEEKTGLLLRLETSGVLTVLAQGMRKPRWLTVAEDKSLYISAKGLGLENGDDEDEEQGEVILRLTPDLALTIFTTGFKRLEGLVVHKNTLFAAAKGLKNENDEHGAIFQIPILANGSAGPISRLTQTEIKKPVGLALDVLGALYVSAEEIELTSKAKDAMGKVAFGGTVTRLVSELKKPRGMALDGFGNLYVADGKGDEHGRILRFRAPPPPALIIPSFTNQSPLTVPGTTGPQSRIDGFLNDSVLPATFTDGTFALILNLSPNAQNALAVFTTAHNGLGLTSAPAEFTIIHDNIPPVVTNLQPLSGSFHNTRTPFIGASFSDNLSGIDTAKVNIQLDGNDVTPQAQVTETGFTLKPLNPLTEGLRTVSVTVFDRAGNSSSVSTTFTVDVTPPDTQIVSGPEGTISATSATFTFTGTDNLTASQDLQFAWHLDSGPFSPFSPQRQVSFTGLSPGPHTFEVKARDLAGNEDLSPAARSFTISTLQVRITQPPNGATVSAGQILVRGTVEAGEAEVGVSVNGIPAAVQGSAFAALIPATPETTTLTAVATSAAGATASHAIAVTVSSTTGSLALLHASPANGIAPLTVNFSLLGETVPTQVTLDADGDGLIDFSGTELQEQPFTYTQPGVYVATATVTDFQGSQFTSSAIVQVYDQVALNVLLQVKWSGMKDALRSGDIAGAVSQIVSSSRPRYEEAFQIIASQLINIDEILTTVSLVRVDNYAAIYEATRIDGGLEMSFEVRFAVDGDGIWRVEAF